MSLDMLMDSTSSHRSLLPEVRQTVPFGRWELVVSQGPKEC